MPTDPNRSNRYQVDQLGNGFDLHGMPNRPLIRVRMSQTCWLIEAACSNDESGEPMRDLPPLGFFERFTLTRRIAELSMRSWQPRAAPPLAALRLRSWAVNQASRSIGYIVKLESERLLRSVNPTILSVQRSVFKIGLGACSLSLHPSFYQCASPFLISDLTRYRAAASAMLILSEALATPLNQYTWTDGRWLSVSANPFLNEISTMAVRAMANIDISLPKFIVLNTKPPRQRVTARGNIPVE
jgi:hypothetical protein